MREKFRPFYSREKPDLIQQSKVPLTYNGCVQQTKQIKSDICCPVRKIYNIVFSFNSLIENMYDDYIIQK